MLNERGITVGGTAVDGRSPAGATVDSPRSSPLRCRHRRRDARQQRQQHRRDAREGTRVRTTAAPARARPGWRSSSARSPVGRSTPRAMVLADGSGLSPDNRATCTALLTVLQRSDPDGPIGTGLPDRRSDRHAGRHLRRSSDRRTPARQDRHAEQPAVQRGSARREGARRLRRRRRRQRGRVRPGAQRTDDLRPERVPTGVERGSPMCWSTYPSGPTPAELGLR